MTWVNIVAGDPVIASIVMANMKHVNYGSDLLPVNSSGVSVDNTLDSGSTTKRWAGTYSYLGNFAGNVNTARLFSISGATGYTAIFGRYPGSGNTSGLFLHSEATESHYNFKISTQDTVSSALTIQVSTAIGGTTWGSSLFTIAQTGAVSIPGSLAVGSGTQATLVSGTITSLFNSATSGTNAYLNIQSGTAGIAGLSYGDSEDDDVAITYLDNSTNIYSIKVAGNIGLSINSSGYVSNVIQHVIGGTPSAYISGTLSSFVSSASAGTNAYVNIQSGSTGIAGLTFGSSVNDDRAYLQFNNNTAVFSLINSGNTGISIDGSGYITNVAKFVIGGTPASFISGTVGAFVSSASAGTNAYLNIQSGTSGNAGITLGDSADDDVSYIYHNNSTNTLTFTNSGNTMSLSSAGLFTAPSLAITGSATVTGGIDIGNTGTTLKCTVLNINTWNMDSTANVNIPHGLTASKIRDVHVIIIQDGGSNFWPINYFDGTGTLGSVGYDSTTVNLNRTSGVGFDGANFNDTVINRGYITIWHTA